MLFVVVVVILSREKERSRQEYLNTLVTYTWIP